MPRSRRAGYARRCASGKERAMNVAPHLVCATLRRLHVQAEGLARFHEWPSGHWQITPKGLDFLAENADPECERG